MKLADFPALTRLPKRQRLKLAEQLWFSGVDDSLPVSAEHKKRFWTNAGKRVAKVM